MASTNFEPGFTIVRSSWLNDVDTETYGLSDYAALRAYTETANKIYITGPLATTKPHGIAGVFQHDSTDTTSADNGGTVIVGADGRRWKRDSAGSVNVLWFGAKRDGVSDDTIPCQNAINAAGAFNKSLDWPEGRYAVSTLTTNGHTVTWNFYEAELLALPSASETCLLKIDCFNSKFYGLKVNLNNNLDYACAVWWYNESAASQYNSFFGLTIMQAWRGLVYGEFPGESSTGLPQSENAVYGFQCYGVWQPIVVNHSNGVLMISSGQLVSGADTWGGGFDNTNNFAFISYAGVLVVEGGEIQNSVAAATSYSALIQGGEVYLNGCMVEIDAPILVDGVLQICSGRILDTRADTSIFYIGPSARASTKLKVNECYLYRPGNVGSFSGNSLVDNAGSSQNIQIIFDNCDINEFASFVSLTKSNNQSVSYTSTRWYPDGTQDEYSGVYLLNSRGQNIIDISSRDSKGYTTDGWYLNNWYGASPVLSLSSDVPNASFAKSLSVTTGGQAGVFTVDPTSLASIKQTGHRVGPKDKFMVEGWVRYVSGGTDDAFIGLVLYDATGAALAAPFLAIDNSVASITSSWSYVRGVVTIPDGSTAAYAGFGAWGLSSEVRFCGGRAYRANWNVV